MGNICPCFKTAPETGEYVAIESQEGVPTTRGVKVQESNTNYYQSILEDASRNFIHSNLRSKADIPRGSEEIEIMRAKFAQAELSPSVGLSPVGVGIVIPQEAANGYSSTSSNSNSNNSSGNNGDGRSVSGSIGNSNSSVAQQMKSNGDIVMNILREQAAAEQRASLHSAANTLGGVVAKKRKQQKESQGEYNAVANFQPMD